MWTGFYLAHDGVQWKALMNMVLGSIKGMEFIDLLIDCQLLKKDSSPFFIIVIFFFFILFYFFHLIDVY
jgi:hypothetical protein